MKRERHLYIVYDIKDDAIRNHLSRRLAYYGLHRVQYSVFDGVVTLRDKISILEEINDMGLGSEDKIHIIDLCDSCRKNAIIIGKKPDVRGHIII